MITFLLILHLVPFIVGIYMFFIIPYFTLKKNSSLYDYLNNLKFISIPVLTVLLILPIFNYVILNSWVSDMNDDEESRQCLDQTVSNIYDFFKEFFTAIWMLIVWMFGLKYVFRLFNKILTLKIK